jgi:predicted metalloprotease
MVAGGVGGLGVIGLLLALLLGGGGEGGIDLGGLLGELGGGQQTSAQELPSDEADDASEFVSAVLGTTETFWSDVFASAGQTYQPATLVLFTGATQSGCGGASSAVGPHYCPLDSTIYIDLGFMEQLQGMFGAQGGDFAEAYIIAHEVAHHVQNLLGISDAVTEAQRTGSQDANELSVALELQADCLAGVWANSLFQRGDVLEPGDIEEALDAAASVGDDRIQAKTQGRIDPESWTHGSSEQRVEWFTTGYETGDPNACDTFG